MSSENEERLLLVEEVLNSARDDLFAARMMGIFRKNALEIYLIEQAVENLQKGAYIFYGIPYAQDIKRHDPLKSTTYIEKIIDAVEKAEDMILARDKIDGKDIIAYSKNYSAIMDKINKQMKIQRGLEEMDASEIKKNATIFIFSKLIVNNTLSNLFDVKILDKTGKTTKDILDEDRLKLLNAKEDVIRRALINIDGVTSTICRMVVNRAQATNGIWHKFTSRELENPMKVMTRGMKIFTMDETFLLMTASLTQSFAEISFLHYVTYPHINPTRYPYSILGKTILPSDYASNKLPITSLSGELISRISKNLRLYERMVKSEKQMYGI